MQNTEPQGEHYRKGKIQPIHYIKANNLDFNEGSVVKYVTRHRFKNGKKDIYKAIDYLAYILNFDYNESIDDIVKNVSHMIERHQ